MDEEERFDAVVVGAGFAGIYMLHRLREMGLSVRLIEAGDGVGGTWHWNRYPGARVDIESLSYSYSFSSELQQEWSWKENFASRDELKSYAEHVVERFDLARDIRLGLRVVSAVRDDDDNDWVIGTDDGAQVRTTYLVCATGSLSTSNLPDIPGIDEFRGVVHHTARWPDEPVELSGKRVGVIGTGSTGIQVVPVVARQAGHLTVFQRTANFSLPIRNSPMDPEHEHSWKERYDEHRAAARQSSGGSSSGILHDFSALSVSAEERERIYEEAWGLGGSSVIRAFNDLMTNQAANDTAADFVRRKIQAIVRDPETAAALCPRDHPIGTKRICMDSGYYETFNRDNVTLVDLKRDPIVGAEPDGLRLASGAPHELDVLILATGFDAVTGPLFAMGVVGTDGRELREAWAEGPRAYLGLATSGFPNMFVLTGPGSPSVLANGFTSIEQHVDFVAALVEHARAHGAQRIEATAEAEDEWVRHVDEVASRTLYKSANSWYLGSNIPGRPRVFMLYAGGAGAFRRRCDEVAANGYAGFVVA